MPGRVLIVEDTASLRWLIRSRLTADYYHVIEAENGETAIELATTEYPDLVLLDVMMPGIDGFEVCRRLKADPATAHIPVVILTALDNREDRVKGLEIGADDFLSKPVDEVALLSRVASLTRMKMMIDQLLLRGSAESAAGVEVKTDVVRATAFPDSRLLIVGASTPSGDCMRAALQHEIGCGIEVAESEQQAIMLIERIPFDAVLIDSELRGGDPLRLGSMVRARPETRQSATLLVGAANTAQATKALEIGFSDYIASPVDLVELIARVRLQLRRKHYSDQLREKMRDSVVQAHTDALTGIYNRRYANMQLGALIERCRERSADLTLMMLDLDRFKQINDGYGHAAGDMVLIEFARRLQASVRSMDLVARVGGEEFMVVMPDTDPRAAAAVAERIRSATAEPAFRVSETGETRAITVSIGFAVLRLNESPMELIQRADTALYASKNAGRNRVTIGDAA